jgi:hypothetical protein
MKTILGGVFFFMDSEKENMELFDEYYMGENHTDPYMEREEMIPFVRKILESLLV